MLIRDGVPGSWSIPKNPLTPGRQRVVQVVHVELTPRITPKDPGDDLSHSGSFFSILNSDFSPADVEGAGFKSAPRSRDYLMSSGLIYLIRSASL